MTTTMAAQKERERNESEDDLLPSLLGLADGDGGGDEGQTRERLNVTVTLTKR